MSCRRHQRFTDAERAELWRRWQQGESASAIGRALAVDTGRFSTSCGARGGWHHRRGVGRGRP